MIIEFILILHRYWADVHDRYWYPCNFGENKKQLNGWTRYDSLNGSDLYQPGALIMDTALESENDNAPLVIRWEPKDETDRFYVYMHFKEIQLLTRNQTRQFNITVNGELRVQNFSPQYQSVDTIYTTSAISGKEIKYTLERTENSTLPPIINAIEIYEVIDLQKPQTFQGDGIFYFLNPFIWFTLCYINITTFYSSFCIEKKLMQLQALSQFME